MPSETKTAYGSRVLRQGRSRPFARNQAKSAASTAQRLVAEAAPQGEYRSSPRTGREHHPSRTRRQKEEFLTPEPRSGQPRALMSAESDLLTKREAAERLRVSASRSTACAHRARSPGCPSGAKCASGPRRS